MFRSMFDTIKGAVWEWELNFLIKKNVDSVITPDINICVCSDTGFIVGNTMFPYV